MIRTTGKKKRKGIRENDIDGKEEAGYKKNRPEL